METLTLSAEESELLATVLVSTLAELRAEITKTDSHDFKEMLKERKRLLMGILEKMEAISAPAA